MTKYFFLACMESPFHSAYVNIACLSGGSNVIWHGMKESLGSRLDMSTISLGRGCDFILRVAV